MEIKKIMKDENHIAKVNDSINEVLEIMDKYHINGMPVVDSDNNLAGMVVKADIYRFMVTPGHYVSCPVEWVMSKSVVSAEADEDFISVAKRLREKNIISMPVLENNKVIGIVSLEDLIDYFLSINK